MTKKATKAPAKGTKTSTARKRSAAPSVKGSASLVPTALLSDVRALIDAARRVAAATVNTAQTQLYWRVGKRIREEVLGSQRAQYGLEIVATLWRQLSWSHFRESPLSRPNQRGSCAERCHCKARSERRPVLRFGDLAFASTVRCQRAEGRLSSRCQHAHA